MPIRPPIHRQYKAREKKSWDRGFNTQKRLTGRALQQRNARIKIRDQFTCQNTTCGLITTGLQVGHRVPVAAGGSDDDGNCRCLCAACHSVKSRIESKGKQLPDPDCFPLTYDEARRLLLYRSGDPIEDDGDDIMTIAYPLDR